MPDQPAILFFASEAPEAKAALKIISDRGWRTLHSSDPAEALEHLMDERVGLLVLGGGALTSFSERLFRQWRQQDPLLEAVGLAGSERPESALVRMDCRRILQPPLSGDALVGAVEEALERRSARAALVRGDEPMAALVLQATQALVTAVERKDVYTRGRADRVALFTAILADEVGGVDVDRIRTAARIMDVGKTGVPEEILNKTERLTEDEFAQVMRHPVISWEMLRHLFLDPVVLDVARHHHERWDGRGYPDGLAGEQIPLEARVAAIADSLDAVTSTRAFRQARLWSEAIDEIVQGGGTRYDPHLVDVLKRAQDRMLVGG